MIASSQFMQQALSLNSQSISHITLMTPCCHFTFEWLCGLEGQELILTHLVSPAPDFIIDGR